MNKTDAKTALEELTLIMLYLTGFKELHTDFDSDVLCAWIGYNFDVLNKLDDEEYIWQGNHPSRTKSVRITQAGIERAKKLMDKYGIEK